MERKDWKGQYKMVKLNEVCRASSSNIILKNIKEKTGDYPVYGASGYIQNIDSYHCNEPYIGIIKDGAGVGKVEIYPAYSSLLGTMQYIHASEKVDLRYIYYKLRSLDFTQYINGAAIPHIYFKDYGQEIIPVPPLPVQARIVDELDCLQGILSKKRQQLAEYHSLAQAIFHQMFGDPVVNEKGWEVKRLGEVTNKIGSGATPKGGDKSYKKEGISLIRSLNVFNSYFKEENLAHIDNEQALALKNVTIEQGDILLNITGASVARCCIVPKHILPARVNQHVSIIRLNDSANQVFLAAQLTNTHMQEKILNISREKAATREALTKSQIEEFSIILPPLPLQQSFAARIAAIDSQREQLAASIRELETLLACRMETLLNCPQA